MAKLTFKQLRKFIERLDGLHVGEQMGLLNALNALSKDEQASLLSFAKVVVDELETHPRP